MLGRNSASSMIDLRITITRKRRLVCVGPEKETKALSAWRMIGILPQGGRGSDTPAESSSRAQGMRWHAVPGALMPNRARDKVDGVSCVSVQPRL